MVKIDKNVQSRCVKCKRSRLRMHIELSGRERKRERQRTKEWIELIVRSCVQNHQFVWFYFVYVQVSSNIWLLRNKNIMLKTHWKTYTMRIHFRTLLLFCLILYFSFFFSFSFVYRQFTQIDANNQEGKQRFVAIFCF